MIDWGKLSKAVILTSLILGSVIVVVVTGIYDNMLGAIVLFIVLFIYITIFIYKMLS